MLGVTVKFTRGTWPSESHEKFNCSLNRTEALSHACLPARASGLPTLDHIGRQSDGKQLARIGCDGTPSPVDLTTRQHCFVQFGQIVVFALFDDMRIDARQVRRQ